MADITYPYTPTNGSVLDVDGLNQDLHSLVDGESIYGELCGNLQAVNLASSFRVRPEHLRPHETARGRQEHSVQTVDFWDLGWPTQDPDADVEDKLWVPVAGAQSRVYVPWDASVVLYDLSAFYTVFRTRERPEVDKATEEKVGPDIQLIMYVDNQRLSYTRRETPDTYAPNDLSDPTPQRLKEYEQFRTQHVNLVHLAIQGSETDDSMTRQGYHDVSLRICVPRNQGVEQLRKPFEDDGLGGRIYYRLSHRIRFGIRSARVLAFI